MEFARLSLPPTLDPTLITWTPARRRPSPLCALCGFVISEDMAELLVFRDDGSGARFCTGCVARHWGMRAEPRRDELPAAKTQPGVEAGALVRWEYPGHCPDCGGSDLTLGPRGGSSVNRRCTNCGQWWNTVWRRSVGLGLIERIREDRRDPGRRDPGRRDPGENNA
jgi:hypothetical protein